MYKNLSAVTLMLFTQYAFAATCPSNTTLQIANERVLIPKEYVMGHIVNKDDMSKERVANVLTKKDDYMTFDKNNANTLKMGVDSSVVRWLAVGEKLTDIKKICFQPYSIDIQEVPRAPVTQTPTTGGSTGECYAAADREYSRIKDSRKNDGHFSFIAFCSDKTTYQSQRSYGVKGDPIYISLYDNESLVNSAFEIQSCSLEQEGVTLYNQAAVSNFRDRLQAGMTGEEEKPPYILTPPLIRTCYDDKVVINLIDRQNGDKVLRSHVLNQHTKYHGSFMLGTLFTDKISHKYVVGNNGAGATVIRDEGPFNTGPTYVISLLLHGLPHYLFDSEPYHGRDILHDNSFSDRVGLMLGVGIDKPQNNLSLGLSFELMRGINLTYSTNWSRVTELDGVKVGDAIAAGTAVPTRDRWERYNSLGVSIDFGYVTGLYGK